MRRYNLLHILYIFHLPSGCYGEHTSPGTIRPLSLSPANHTHLQNQFYHWLMCVTLCCETMKLGQLERSLVRHKLPVGSSAQKQDKGREGDSIWWW